MHVVQAMKTYSVQRIDSAAPAHYAIDGVKLPFSGWRRQFELSILILLDYSVSVSAACRLLQRFAWPQRIVEAIVQSFPETAIECLLVWGKSYTPTRCSACARQPEESLAPDRRHSVD